MSAVSMDIEEFFCLNEPAEQFDFIDYHYLHAYASPREIRELVQELTH